MAATEDALSGRALAVSAGGKLEPVSGREGVVDEFADVITKGAWELARQLGGVAVDDLGGLARVVEAHSGWIELLDQALRAVSSWESRVP